MVNQIPQNSQAYQNIQMLKMGQTDGMTQIKPDKTEMVQEETEIQQGAQEANVLQGSVSNDESQVSDKIRQMARNIHETSEDVMQTLEKMDAESLSFPDVEPGSIKQRPGDLSRLQQYMERKSNAGEAPPMQLFQQSE